VGSVGSESLNGGITSRSPHCGICCSLRRNYFMPTSLNRKLWHSLDLQLWPHLRTCPTFFLSFLFFFRMKMYHLLMVTGSAQCIWHWIQRCTSHWRRDVGYQRSRLFNFNRALVALDFTTHFVRLFVEYILSVCFSKHIIINSRFGDLYFAFWNKGNKTFDWRTFGSYSRTFLFISSL